MGNTPQFNPNAPYSPAQAQPVFNPNASYAPAQPAIPGAPDGLPNGSPAPVPAGLSGNSSAPIDPMTGARIDNAGYQQQTQDIGQGISKAGSDVAGAVKSIPSAVYHANPLIQVNDSIKQSLPILDAYEKTRSGGGSVADAITAANDQADKQNGVGKMLQDRVADFKKNPTQESVRGILDIAALAASIYGGGEAVGGEAATEEGTGELEASTDAASEAETAPTANNSPAEGSSTPQTPTSPPTASSPGIVQKIKQAVSPNEATQPGAQAGMREAAGIPEGQSLRTGIDVETPMKVAKDLYGQIDEAAGTDFKGLYDKLDTAQDAAREAASGSAEEAKAELNIKNTQDAIDEAKQMAAKQGIQDVDKSLAKADAKFTEAQANKDLNSKFFNRQGIIKGNTAHGSPETIDVDKGIDALENLDKKNKFGVSRLQQSSLGEDGAFKLKQALYDAQKTGAKVLTRNKILGILSTGATIEGIRSLFSH
jgi:hypothetical protein